MLAFEICNKITISLHPNVHHRGSRFSPDQESENRLWQFSWLFLSKKTVSWDFRPLFFCLKDSTPAPYKQAKVLRTFSFLRRWGSKIACFSYFSLGPEVFVFLDYFCWVCKHTQVPISPFTFFHHLVVDYAYTMFASSLSTLTPCPHSERLFQHLST